MKKLRIPVVISILFVFSVIFHGQCVSFEAIARCNTVNTQASSNCADAPMSDGSSNPSHICGCVNIYVKTIANEVSFTKIKNATGLSHLKKINGYDYVPFIYRPPISKV